MAALNEFDATLLAGGSEGLTFSALRVGGHRGPDAKPGVYEREEGEKSRGA